MPSKPTGLSLVDVVQYARDMKCLERLVVRANKKANANEGYLGRCVDDLRCLFRMIRAWATGRYKCLPYGTILGAIAAVVYFVNPWDIVPDVVLPLGLMDDMTVVRAILKSIARDIERFRAWEGNGM